MKIIKSILTKNPCYTAGRKITVKGLMLHSVGCAQPSAQVFVRMWNRHFLGITGAGIVDPAGTDLETIHISAWRCVSLQRSGIQAVVHLPAPIWQMQEPVQDVHITLLWSCSPICAKSMALTQ